MWEYDRQLVTDKTADSRWIWIARAIEDRKHARTEDGIDHSPDRAADQVVVLFVQRQFWVVLRR